MFFYIFFFFFFFWLSSFFPSYAFVSWCQDLIICFARHTDHEQILFSGSKDKTVHVWDLRQSQPAGTESISTKSRLILVLF